MTIDEAIKVLEYHLNPDPAKNYKPVADAVKLGIEALRRIQKLRADVLFDGGVSLPGETKT